MGLETFFYHLLLYGFFLPVVHSPFSTLAITVCRRHTLAIIVIFGRLAAYDFRWFSYCDFLLKFLLPVIPIYIASICAGVSVCSHQEVMNSTGRETHIKEIEL